MAASGHPASSRPLTHAQKSTSEEIWSKVSRRYCVLLPADWNSWKNKLSFTPCLSHSYARAVLDKLGGARYQISIVILRGRRYTRKYIHTLKILMFLAK